MFIKVTDLDEGEVLGTYDVPVDMLSRLDELFSGSDLGWELVSPHVIKDEADLRQRFNLMVCDHQPMDYLNGSCVCGWKRGVSRQ